MQAWALLFPDPGRLSATEGPVGPPSDVSGASRPN